MTRKDCTRKRARVSSKDLLASMIFTRPPRIPSLSLEWMANLSTNPLPKFDFFHTRMHCLNILIISHAFCHHTQFKTQPTHTLQVTSYLESLDILPSTKPQLVELFVAPEHVSAKSEEAASLPALAIDELSLQVILPKASASLSLSLSLSLSIHISPILRLESGYLYSLSLVGEFYNNSYSWYSGCKCWRKAGPPL